jgi:hypothetical protein
LFLKKHNLNVNIQKTQSRFFQQKSFVNFACRKLHSKLYLLKNAFQIFPSKKNTVQFFTKKACKFCLPKITLQIFMQKLIFLIQIHSLSPTQKPKAILPKSAFANPLNFDVTFVSSALNYTSFFQVNQNMYNQNERTFHRSKKTRYTNKKA